MDRLVREIDRGRRDKTPEQRAFSTYADQAHLVLLGDPGAGKSHLFRSAAQTVGGRYTTVRAFLVSPAGAPGQTLFIDGLDERRAGRGDRDTVEALVGKLFAAAPAKVRISCRVADWLGESDLASLRPFFEQDGEPAVVTLERLSKAEREAVLCAQGAAADEAASFLRDAEERGLADFLDNPQNLIMLWRTVQSGQWPESRTALFELSTELLLREADPDHARSGNGVFSAAELRRPAGAVCAARLISDIEAISLSDQEGTSDIPSYRSLGLAEPAAILAALGRRAFVAGPVAETVDYAHRTTAEYLGAAWLAEAVRKGLPFARLQALVGVDGHPAPELRGLHAWLAIHLPEYADRVIEADPYGVLTYGDAASLSPSSCTYLVRALGRLSQTDPWFRAGTWDAPAVGALAREDMVEAFRAVMNDADAGFGVRSIVAQALATGRPIPALKEDLARILVRSASTFAERSDALRALLRLGDAGREAVVEAYRHQLGNDGAALRLRAQIVSRLYGAPFDASDVVQLLADCLATDHQLMGGILWRLPDQIPAAGLAEVLDGLEPVRRGGRRAIRNAWDVASVYERSLVRVWQSELPFDPDRAFRWLTKRRIFAGSRGGSHDELAAALRGTPERLRAIADQALTLLPLDDQRWLHLSRIREILLFQLNADHYLDALVAQFDAAEPKSQRALVLYEATLIATYSDPTAHSVSVFERFYAMAEGGNEFTPIRDANVRIALPDNYIDRKARRQDDEEERDPDHQRRQFERDAEAIRGGLHLGWLAWAAKIYFAIFNDVDSAATPRERLVSALGEQNALTALAGFRALLSRNDIPALDAMVVSIADRSAFEWWYGVLAGIDEIHAEHDGVDAVPDALLSSMLVFALAHPIAQRGSDDSYGWLVHPWIDAAVRERPEFVCDCYAALARAQFARGEPHVDGLHELLTNEAFASCWQEPVLGILRDFPNAPQHRLDEMMDAVLAEPALHVTFLDLAERVISGARVVDPLQHDMWLAAAYLLAPARYEAEVEARAAVQPEIIFELRDRGGYERRQRGERLAHSLAQLHFLARVTGSHFPRAGTPSDGWGGNRNPWDASDYFDTLINAIAASPSEAATAALAALEADTRLSSYRENLRHALANQRARRREAEYDRPDWTRTVTALANGPPATGADLHALVVAHFDELRKRIASENTDLFKAYWNIDSFARLVSPRPEEACRDTLAALLKANLAPLGLTVEPEGHMVADKRADISVAMPGRKIVCELKRDYHAEVWTAVESQLDRFYTRDPDAQGFGLYVVFWFGAKRPSQVPAPPGGRAIPTTPAEMEALLKQCLPEDQALRISVVVIDVSGEAP